MKKTILWPYRVGLFSFCLVSLFLPMTVFGVVESFVFTLNPEEILINEATQFTIQAQEGGNEMVITDTFDIYLESDSNSGSFSSNGSNWQSVTKVTMSKNTKNKNFYYKDSQLQTVNITVIAKNRVSGEEWNLDHRFEVVDELLKQEDDDESDEDNSDENDNSDDDSSAHKNPAPLSTKKSKIDLEIDAGRKRLAMVGQEIKFFAEQVVGENSQQVDYVWSFGDGLTKRGQEVVHVYSQPGVYNIVLNAKSGDSQAVARTKATIVEAMLEIKVLDLNEGLISVVNNGETEVNIGDFVLTSGDQSFTLAADTILDRGGKLVLDKNITGLDLSQSDKILLKIAEEVVAETPLAEGGLVLTEDKLVALKEIEQEVNRLAEVINSRARASFGSNNRPIVIASNVVKREVEDEKKNQIEYNETEELATSSNEHQSVVILETPNRWWQQVLSLPDKGLALISNIF